MGFVRRTSIHGRRLGLTSTNGIYGQIVNSTATDADTVAQMWGPGMFETVSSAGAAIANYGITIVSSDSTSGTTPFLVGAPVQGVYKEIHFQTSATASALNTTSTTIKFNSTLAEAAAGGTTALTVAGAATGIGGVIVLRGLSTTAWGIVSHTVSISS